MGVHKLDSGQLKELTWAYCRIRKELTGVGPKSSRVYQVGSQIIFESEDVLSTVERLVSDTPEGLTAIGHLRDLVRERITAATQELLGQFGILVHYVRLEHDPAYSIVRYIYSVGAD